MIASLFFLRVTWASSQEIRASEASPLEKWRKYVEDYLDALIKEIQAVSQMMKNRKLDTVYIGGGTPTTLEPDQLRRLLGAITEYFPCG